mmetsp:Transcript_27759/g.92266  ORF Transcript_27759/g.92266 Transcript_27759/m.92266 type:complete len:642 (+) Transcript_27759:82-2007(+)
MSGDPIRWLLPLGSNCLAATWLKQQGLRKFSLPFDWAFSSPKMISDCLADDFRTFLDTREFVAIGRRGAGSGHSRYSALRLPGRWRDFVFLHHDPLRKRQDLEYLQRSVARFRNVVSSDGRKLMLHCNIVDSKEALAEVRGGAAEEGPSAQASWGHCNRYQVEALFDALYAYGARDFQLVAVTICVGEASEADQDGAPVMRCCASGKHSVVDAPSAAHGNLAEEACCKEVWSVNEVHLVKGYGSEDDPFKFFGDERNESMFAEAVFGVGSRRLRFDLSEAPDGYEAQGYRDAPVESTSSLICDQGQTLTCQWCGQGGFTSRNRLFAHIRSEPECASAASKAAPLQAAPRSTSITLAFLIGYIHAARPQGGSGAVERSLLEALKVVGATEVQGRVVGRRWLGCHQHDFEPEADDNALNDDGHLTSALTDVFVVSLMPVVMGEALLKGLSAALSASSEKVEELRVHAYAKMQRGAATELDSHAHHSYIYLLPFSALCGGAEAQGLEASEQCTVPEHIDAASKGAESDASRREVYRKFKVVLRDVLLLERKRTDGAEADGCEEADMLRASSSPLLEQFKMAERLQVNGVEHVALRLSGRALQPAFCCTLVAAAVGAHKNLICLSEEVLRSEWHSQRQCRTSFSR